MEDNIMQKDSFIYKGYYYEYSKEELEPEVYLKELEPSLIQLLEKRKNKIKDIICLFHMKGSVDCNDSPIKNCK